MKLSNFLGSYRKLTSGLLSQFDEKEAMSLAVGSDFEAVGRIEHYLLLKHGLKKDHVVVDVGCGSGRLAMQLKDSHAGKYVGIDVVTELFEYARRSVGRPDWEFRNAPGLTIPLPDNSADFVCFFSVFTHLPHHETYRYLEDARRVLKPSGRIVFSFIEFRIASHWPFFAHQVAHSGQPDVVLNQFMSRDGIESWVAHLGLAIVEMADGDKPHIPLPQPVRWDNGCVMEGKGNLGQSVCVLAKA